LSSLDHFDEELVQRKEKEKEKERRERVREERIAVQKEQYAQRLQVRSECCTGVSWLSVRTACLPACLLACWSCCGAFLAGQLSVAVCGDATRCRWLALKLL
jgi:hypothetical protein